MQNKKGNKTEKRWFLESFNGVFGLKHILLLSYLYL
jgi:hypothetical protein